MASSRGGHPVTVTIAGRTLAGTGRVLCPCESEYSRSSRIYWDRHANVDFLPGDRLVRITLDEEPA